jgi:hypothetical protein
VVLAAVVSTPVAATAAPLVPTIDPSARIRTSLAQLDVIDAQRAVEDAQLALAEQQEAAVDTRDVEVQAEAGVADAQRGQAAAEGELRSARDRLGSTAVYAYMNTPGDDEGEDQERELLTASIEHHQRLIADAEVDLERAEDGVDAAQRVLAAAQATAAEQDDRVGGARLVLQDARDQLRTATAAVWQPTLGVPWQLTIEGESAFTPSELVEWYEAQGQGSNASVPIADLIRSFVEDGDAEGVRGDMAFAQAIHETGWFTNTDTVVANNFAGIGHCDACAGGYRFATAEIGVLAQIQLLKSYAEEDPVFHLPRADPDLNGPRGCCPTWTDLGGVWATSPGYGQRILGYYADMLEWLVARRSTELP